MTQKKFEGLEIEIYAHFVSSDQELFWVLIPRQQVNIYSKSPRLFFDNLFGKWPASKLHKLISISTCQYIDNDKEGIDWLLWFEGRIHINNIRSFIKRALSSNTKNNKSYFQHHHAHKIPSEPHVQGL